MFKDKQALTFRLIELTAILSAVILAIGTRWGTGVGGDATIYITSAQSLLNGLGLGLPGPQGEFRLLPYFPPFFSLVLSFFGLFHLNLTESARWLNIVCYAGLVYLVGRFTYRFSQQSILSLLAALMVALSPILIPVYAWAMSEPLSAILGFGGIILAIYAIKYPAKTGYLVSAGLLTGLSFLTRYSALAFVAAALMGFIFLSRESWGRRLVKGVIFGIISAVPMIIWLVYDVINTTTVGSRRMLAVGDMVSRLASFWQPLRDSILIWMIPDSWYYQPAYPASINRIIVPAALVFLAAWVVILAIRMKKSPADFDESFKHLAVLLAGFVIFYFVIIFGVYLTTYPPITIANRMLSPLYTALIWLVVLMAILTGVLWNQNKAVRSGLTVFLTLVCVYYGWRSARLVTDYYHNGLGYSAPSWQQSQTMEQVRSLPAGTIIVTNETTAIQFLANRPSYPLMEIYNDHPLKAFTRYGDGSEDPQQSLQGGKVVQVNPQQMFHDGKAVLVLFDTIDDQLSGLYGDRTNERISDLVKGLNQTYRGSDGGIFYYPKP